MDNIKLCINCQEPLDPEFINYNQKFCSNKCRNANWYVNNKEYHKKLYQEKKKKWEQSPSGKREGTPIRYWLRLPKSWQ